MEKLRGEIGEYVSTAQQELFERSETAVVERIRDDGTEVIVEAVGGEAWEAAWGPRPSSRAVRQS